MQLSRTWLRLIRQGSKVDFVVVMSRVAAKARGWTVSVCLWWNSAAWSNVHSRVDV